MDGQRGTRTPAGWYHDPQDPGHMRYWDGRQWTDHRAPKLKQEVPTPQGASGPATDPGAPWEVRLIAGLLVVPIILLIVATLLG